MRAIVRLATTVLLLAGLVLAGAPTVTQAAPTPSRPNVVLIMTDDQSIRMLDAMPHVRELIGDRGVTFTQAMVPTSLCCPSRASTLTGRYAHDTLVYRNFRPFGGWETFNDSGAESQTLAVWLDDAGYETALVGKYLNGFGLAAPDVTPPGWDRMVTFFNVRSARYYNYELRTTVAGVTNVSAYGGDPASYSTDALRDQAVSVVEAVPATQPLFLMFTPYAPHAPYTAAPRHLDSWPTTRNRSPAFNEADVSDKPDWIQGLNPVRRAYTESVDARRHESLRAVDDAVLAIHDALGDRAADTLFVFMSDNGLSLGEHRYIGKGVPHAMATRIPLLMRWDGRLPAGVRDEGLAANIDVTATVLAAAGVEVATSGRSLLEPQRRRGLLIEGAPKSRGSYCGWRTQRWLFVQSANGEQELYDYVNDPDELDNVAGRKDYAVPLQRLAAKAQDACVPVPPDFAW